ncbi:hypothetical protein QJS10_CPB12g00516 [Acorus calamus]|uniref:Uncharacterized protein n=1 Tax=Acorus calamus TaxID=4465 RepID=A0AAV9DLF0_ACOCL|nr:hypothetical protein QJS10_CPB12g00516 [Acorus calamus]
MTPPSWPLGPRYPHTSRVALETSTADSLPGPRNVQAWQGILKSPSLDRTYLCALRRQTSTLTVRSMVIQLQVHKSSRLGFYVSSKQRGESSEEQEQVVTCGAEGALKFQAKEGATTNEEEDDFGTF